MNITVYYTRVPYLENHPGALDSDQKDIAMPKIGTANHPFQSTSVAWNQTDLDAFFNGPIGYSPHELVGGHRLKANYLRTHFLLIDMDNGTPAQDFCKVLDQHPYRPLYYIHFSANSQPQYNKYHIILPIDTPVDGYLQHELLTKWILQEFGAYDPDLTVIKDCARGVLRGNGAFPTLMGGLAPLKTQLILDDQRKKLATQKALSVKSKLDGNVFFVSFQEEVQLDGPTGPWEVLGDLDPEDKPRILCPVCGHRSDLRSGDNHNAVFMLNAKGIPIVFCSSCQARGWGSGGAGVYNIKTDELQAFVEDKHHFKIFRDVRDNKFRIIRQDKQAGGRIISPITWEGIHNWYGEVGISAPTAFPNMDFVMAFDQDVFLDMEHHIVNIYQAPDVLKAPVADVPVGLPTYIGHLIRHIAGDDQECLNRFLDWLAWIVQTRQKMITTWLFQGTQGTGKGVFFNHVISPMFGRAYCMLQDMKTVMSNFNGTLEDKVFLGLDEVQADFTDVDRNVIEARIKHWIGEDHVRIERKGVDARMSRIYTNFLFFSNKFNAVQLEPGDRRFNVCPRQETKLDACGWLPNHNTLDLIPALEAEVPDFVQFLKQRKVVPSAVHQVLDNQAKRDMMDVTQSIHDTFFQKVRELDKAWMVEHISEGFDPAKRPLASNALRLISDSFTQNFFTYPELHCLYNNIVHEGITDLQAMRFSKKLTSHGIRMTPNKINGISVKVFRP
jgi:hypothetical protein